MNKELELEAENYYREDVEGEPLTHETPIHCFIAGATSKYVEKQKIEFAIEQLKKLKESEIYDKIRYVESGIIDYELMKLEQKLSEL